MHYFELVSGFSDIAPKSQLAKEKKIDKLNFIKIKLLCISGHYQETEEIIHRVGDYLQIIHICLLRD